MPALMVAWTASSIEIISTVTNVGCYGRGCTEATVRADALAAAFFVDEDNHPNTDSTSMT
jgi:hypothetical protein